MPADSGHQVFIADFPPNLGFKANAGEHYMIIDSYESKNAIESQGSKLSSIGLYIPAGSLTTSYTGNYEAKEGARQAAEAMSGLSSDDSLWKKIVDAANIGGSKIFSKAAIQSDQATGFFSAQGETPNNHMALVYRGPNTFRQHTFAFKFFPKNSAESKTVQSIIAELKFGTLPIMSGSSGTIKEPFFKSPRHHEINFYQGGTGASGGGKTNSKLFSIGKSVISNLVLNYDPQSVVSFHNDGSPVQIDMTITFQEIELQINTKDAIQASADRGVDGLANAIEQNQSSSQTTSEQQAEQQRVANDIQAPLAGSGRS